MFGSAILDVAIGLTFVYLLFSLIVTAAQEVIESFIKLRAAHLAKGIQKLLGSEKTKEFFEHALIKGLSPDAWFGNKPRKPSYIPAQTFSTTVLNMIAKPDNSGETTIQAIKEGINSLKDENLKQVLTTLLQEGHGKVEKFEENLQSWFNSQMERVSGWYKRKVQLIMLVVAFMITIGMNADSLVLTKALSNDEALRASLVAQAQEIAKQPLVREDQENIAILNEIKKEVTGLEGRIKAIQELGLPLKFGWWSQRPDNFNLAEAIPGWLLTTLAISLGAPFWFDILSKIMSIRSTGKTPDK
jgi:hypothetical protein